MQSIINQIILFCLYIYIPLSEADIRSYYLFSSVIISGFVLMQSYFHDRAQREDFLSYGAPPPLLPVPPTITCNYNPECGDAQKQFLLAALYYFRWWSACVISESRRP